MALKIAVLKNFLKTSTSPYVVPPGGVQGLRQSLQIRRGAGLREGGGPDPRGEGDPSLSALECSLILSSRGLRQLRYCLLLCPRPELQVKVLEMPLYCSSIDKELRRDLGSRKPSAEKDRYLRFAPRQPRIKLSYMVFIHDIAIWSIELFKTRVQINEVKIDDRQSCAINFTKRSRMTRAIYSQDNGTFYIVHDGMLLVMWAREIGDKLAIAILTPFDKRTGIPFRKGVPSFEEQALIPHKRKPKAIIVVIGLVIGIIQPMAEYYSPLSIE